MPIPSGNNINISPNNGTQVIAHAFSFVGENGVVVTGNQSSNTITFSASGSNNGLINVKTFGATGNGVTDDTNSIQSAINYCRNNGYGIYFPTGTYIVSASLDFGNWENFTIAGDGPGSAGIAGEIGLSVISSKNANVSVAFDFSGSAYGTVSGIAFLADSTVNCCLLLARTTGNTVTNYGSDILFTNCNFSCQIGISTRAVIVSQSAEVITFDECRIHYSGVPAFVFTSRASSFWGVTSSYYTAISSGFSLTLIRFYGGEITGDNAMAIVLDAATAISGADITISACYVGVSGSNTYFLQALTGSWNNISIESTRVEVTFAGSNYGGINLPSSSMLSNIDIQMDVTSGDFITGSGSVVAGYLNSAAPINMSSGGVLNSLILATPNPVNIICPTIENCKVMSQPNSISNLSASIKLEVDDGNGGVIIAFQPLFSAGSYTYNFPTTGVTNGLYIFSYSGASVAIWYSTTGGFPSATKIWTSSTGIGIITTGTLTGAQSNFTVTATFNGNGDNFIVRRSNTALFAG